ncbi:hypothetical protein HK096_009449, partial [Nowakowskiella sp. JEL0078]
MSLSVSTSTSSSKSLAKSTLNNSMTSGSTSPVSPITIDSSYTAFSSKQKIAGDLSLFTLPQSTISSFIPSKILLNNPPFIPPLLQNSPIQHLSLVSAVSVAFAAATSSFTTQKSKANAAFVDSKLFDEFVFSVLPIQHQILDEKSRTHIANFIRQTLDEMQIDHHPWERLLMDLSNQIAMDIPKILSKKNQQQEAQRGDALDIITIKTAIGHPSESCYFPVKFEDANFENNSNPNTGTVFIYGPEYILIDIQLLMEIVVFMTANCKFEMSLFQDHHSRRTQIPISSIPSRTPTMFMGAVNFFSQVILGSNRYIDRKQESSENILSSSPEVVFPKSKLILKEMGPISNFIQHQSISFSFLSTLSQKPCAPPSLISIHYYSKASDYKDVSISNFIRILCSNSMSICSNPTCNSALYKHVISYFSGNHRISVSLALNPELSSHFSTYITSADTEENGKNIIVMWSECAICNSRTECVRMSSETSNFSFGKYLELLCYGNSFTPQFSSKQIKKVGCDHHKKDQSSAILRNFENSGCVLTFEVQRLDLFGLRYSNRGNKFYGTDWKSDFRRVRRKEEDRLKDELQRFFLSLYRNLEILSAQVIATKSEGNEIVEEDNRFIFMLDDMLKKFKELESTVFNTVGEMVEKDRNNFSNIKKWLKKVVEDTIIEVELWKKEFADKLLKGKEKSKGGSEKLEWSKPEYIDNKVHLLPLSSVEVREEEPTSIIAYTIGSQEYKQLVDLLETHPINTLQIQNSDTISATRQDSAISSIEINNNLQESDRTFEETSILDSEGWKHYSSDKTGFRSKITLFSHDVASTKNPCHLKYRFRQGNDIFLCTVYYVQQFEELRKKFGIAETYVKSLARCSQWLASGGKSRATFFKSQDEKFVIKQLATKWTVVEKDELLKFAPRYLEYVKNSDKNPSLLARIYGFYSIKHENSQTREIMELDVVVMEHLFADVSISRLIIVDKFDLKGVPDRHVDQKTASSKVSDVLWDGDWVDGRCYSEFLLGSESKKFISEAISNDTFFLAASNIMDYSLLVGVNDENKELVIGIVDFIGSYTWSKRLESQSKAAMSPIRGRLATVLPPE